MPDTRPDMLVRSTKEFLTSGTAKMVPNAACAAIHSCGFGSAFWTMVIQCCEIHAAITAPSRVLVPYDKRRSQRESGESARSLVDKVGKCFDFVNLDAPMCAGSTFA